MINDLPIALTRNKEILDEVYFLRQFVVQTKKIYLFIFTFILDNTNVR